MSKYVIPRIDEPIMTPNGTMSLPWYLYLKQGGSGGGGGGGGGSTDNYIPPMLSYQRSDHKLNDMQWLRADTFSWQNGKVYFGAYQHLLDDYEGTKLYAWHTRNSGGYNLYTKVRNPEVGTQLYASDGSASPYTIKSVRTGTSGESVEYIYVDVSEYETDVEFYRQNAYDTHVSETETIAGITITYYPGEDGHKIVLSDQKSNVAAIYNKTGDAWYYILDTTNQRFKLPRTKKPETNFIPDFANQQTVTMPFTAPSDGWFIAHNVNTTTTVYVNDISVAQGNWYYGSWSGNLNCQIIVKKGDVITGATGTMRFIPFVEADYHDKNENKYLYFYVGAFTEDAIKNTAGLNAEMFNDLNAHKVVAFQAPTADNSYTWYRKYADGWVEQGGRASGDRTVYLPVVMSDANYTLVITKNDGDSGTQAYGTSSITSSSFYANRYTSGLGLFSWQVSGMAAQGD